MTGTVTLALLLVVLTSDSLLRVPGDGGRAGVTPAGIGSVTVMSGSAPPGMAGPGVLQASVLVQTQPVPLAFAPPYGALSWTLTGPEDRLVPASLTLAINVAW